MGEITDIKDRLKKRKEVKIWFWDGIRQYEGVAAKLSEEFLAGDLRITEEGDATVIPGHALMQGLMKHLANRVVTMKLTSSTLEVSVKAKITAIGPMEGDNRRASIIAEFEDVDDGAKSALRRMAQGMPK
ncbi:MAG: hypothetical protein ACYTAF_04675 [Planctomycetota bacterium]|jgi:hypothetical protein